jgi:hypothetical protein
MDTRCVNFGLAGIFLVILFSLVMLPGSKAAAAAIQSPMAAAAIGGCPVFPVDNIWNTPVDTIPVHPNSAQYIAAVGMNGHLHPDFGSGTWNGGPIGIPFNIVPGHTGKVNFTFTWPGESDAGPYPIPSNPLIEFGSDHHLLVIDQDACKLYELYNVTAPQDSQGWKADAGAIFDLHSNTLRPAGWTSADAAGLPMTPGLVRYDEVLAGHIDHALRFTVINSKTGYIWPARHNAPSGATADSPVMGLRFRLKASFDISHYSTQAQVILKALKKYGMIVADNGSSWYISGAPDERWDNNDLGSLKNIAGSNFEVVDESSLTITANSAQALNLAIKPRVWIPMVIK